MAIKVGGTTVIDDSRALSNIASVDATTVAALSNAGVGAGGGVFEATASGSLSNGDTVTINSDGTVSVVSSSGNPQSEGTIATYRASTTLYNSAAYDSNSNKVVVAYVEGGNLKAQVGTVSGTSISFGSVVDVDSSNQDGLTYLESAFTACTFDSTNNKIIIVYNKIFSGGTYYLNGIVGTVSGTSISFGTPYAINTNGLIYDFPRVVFDSNAGKAVVFYHRGSFDNAMLVNVLTVSGTSLSAGLVLTAYNSASTQGFGVAFDSNSNKIVVTFRGASGYPTAGVGTISGTSISFGTFSAIANFSTNDTSCTFDPDTNQVIAAVSDSDNDGLKVYAGSVSGTSITWGTAQSLYEGTGSAAGEPSIVYDTNVNKFLVAFALPTDNDFMTVTGTVSGTNVSLADPVQITTNNSRYHGAVFDSSNNKVVVGYRDATNSSNGKAVVIATSDFETNLTANSFIGFSDGAYSNGQTVTVQTVGSVNTAQSGLSAGLGYYVLTDGTLSTTQGDPVVYAGVAVASDKIIVKG